mmetsp:Transcript_9552/g.15328  ORF Transcript_9552/g.15328 Transcript_9552/m.15328 type:complete len:785 (-) Transcript_9552:630-2984(-)|eukprot:CAMPEP_0178746768 /NCGR_PEP_ID=MMETSP0744-20121128/7976_1 /TAXON_ID=913974 /ORGANISM="Nitzschia punctata, Strain CCMP561" /LENGTH=784 /DNA_ID=CAMNT_0020399983 /DNA_START=176 /DNA_END=2530 /DNA_ORIENTATION=-
MSRRNHQVAVVVVPRHPPFLPSSPPLVTSMLRKRIRFAGTVVLSLLLNHLVSSFVVRSPSVSIARHNSWDGKNLQEASIQKLPLRHSNHVVVTAIETTAFSTTSVMGDRQRQPTIVLSMASRHQDHEDNDFADDDEDELQPVGNYFEDGDVLTASSLKGLTIPQLKQQLRLRGLKVSGKKQDLVNRLLHEGRAFDDELHRDDNGETVHEQQESLEPDIVFPDSREESKSSREEERQAAEAAQGKEFIDVTAYLDEDEQGKDFKSSMPQESKEEEDENTASSDPEVWGADAKIVDDYEGRSPVVDCLSRTVVEFRGSNRTMVSAYVVASRDAMKPFLQGGQNRTIANSDPEAQLREIQMKREMADKRPVSSPDEEALDEGDERGHYKNALTRDYSDWGKYSVTGAQISAQEVQGILILSDVYGPFTEATKMLAEKIAFECQPVVCMVPDLFRGNPWKEDVTTPGFNENGQDYEEWRATHSDLRVSIDIRAAAAVLREKYGVTSIVVWGTCYGGGRALEAAAGYLPGGQVHDVDGSIGPLPVDPDVAVAWYPTRYNSKALFGPERSRHLFLELEEERNFAVMGIFAGNDKLPGATPSDAAELKDLLAKDDRIKDYMIKVFPDQDHGFAHNSLGRNHDESELDRFVDENFGGAGRVSINDGDAEVACLLSTAFMETYSRKFLPTTGPAISKDESASEWNEDLSMKNLEYTYNRDVRQEIDDSLKNFKEDLDEGILIDPEDETQRDAFLEVLRKMEPEDVPPELKIKEEDDFATVYAKLTARDDFQLF